MVQAVFFTLYFLKSNLESALENCSIHFWHKVAYPNYFFFILLFFKSSCSCLSCTWYQFGTCSFICPSTSTRRQRGNLFGLWVKLPLVTTSLTTQWKRRSRKILYLRIQQANLLAAHYPLNAERQAGKLW